MVISRTTCTRKDGSKHRIVYYSCGNWKNKGTTVCKSNGIRVEKANQYVYSQIEKILKNDCFLQEVLNKVNQKQIYEKEQSQRELEKAEKRLELILSRKKKIFESFEDDLISKDEFLERRSQIKKEKDGLRMEIEQFKDTIATEKSEEIPSEYVKYILSNFAKVLSSDIDRSLRKQMLHLLIKEITIDKSRKIDTIRLQLTDELIRFIENNGVTPPDGVPPVFIFRQEKLSFIPLELTI